MNIGKRGQSYIVIDTGCEDIYYVPKEYQEDYLKGEILICCMSTYHYLKDLKDPKDKKKRKNPEIEIPYDEILSVFSLILSDDFQDKLQAYLKGERIEIPKIEISKLKQMESDIKKIRTLLYKTYLYDEPKEKIRSENINQLNNQENIYMISARLFNYASSGQIKQLFIDRITDTPKPLSPSSLDFLNV